MSVLTMEDANYLVQQSSGQINMILSGMTALMNDTENKVSAMESQKWYQRMVKTITGKNKLTQSEIEQNHDKLNAYMSEAIAELYNRNCIEHEVIMSLGTQLNEIYADQTGLKQMLGMFVSKLNEKIDSIDNFNMLVTEIERGVYSQKKPIVEICRVISQFDNRMMDESRKLDIIKRSLVSQNIVNDNEVLLIDYIKDILNVPVDDIGKIYLELGTIRNSFMANILLGIMEKYHFLPDLARKMKNKNALIDEIINEQGLDGSIALSINEIYDDFVNSKVDVKNSLVPIDTGSNLVGAATTAEPLHNSTPLRMSNSTVNVGSASMIERAEKLYLNCQFDEAFELFKMLADEGNARAMYFVGKCYKYQYGHIVKDVKEGEKWLRKGYELGDVLSTCGYICSSLCYGDEYQQLKSKIVGPILKLAESGDVFAQYEAINVVEDDDEQLKWCKRAAESGNWGAIHYLGLFHQYGEYDLEPDINEAIKYYELCAKKGYAEGYIELADLYESGEDVPQDKERAMELYQQAYSLGSGRAAKRISDMYFDMYFDSFIEDNENLEYKEKELSWLKKAVELGNAYALNSMGSNYYSGDGVNKSIPKAKELFLKALDNGYDKSARYLGMIAMDEEFDYDAAVKYFEIAANRGDDEAQNKLGECYYNGYGVDEDNDEAFKWFTEAAEQDNADAMRNVGECYYYGYGVSEDEDKAREWLRKAAEHYSDEAKENLKEWFDEDFDGETDTDSSESSYTTDDWDSMLSSIKLDCELYLSDCNGAINYDITHKIKKGLDIMNEEIYIAHDDTLFKSGQDGFAITACGISFRGIFESDIEFTSYDELAKVDKVYVSDSIIHADNHRVAYVTGASKSDMNKLKELFESIVADANLWLT